MLISVFICSTIALLLFDFCEQCKLHDDLDPEICDDTSDLCTDPGFQRWVCCNSSGYIPLPSALESCTFNHAAISCHRSLNIANKARVSIPQDRPGKLTDGDVGTYIEVKSNSTENWIVEFEAWVSVYSIVLLTYGDDEVKIDVKMPMQITSEEWHNVACNRATSAKSKRHIFYCLSPSEEDFCRGFACQRLEISIETYRKSVLVSDIEIYENKGTQCGKPGGYVGSTNRTRFNVGMSVSVSNSCDGRNIVNRTCGTSGQWSGTAPICLQRGRKCSENLDAPANGEVMIVKDGRQRSLWYLCDFGYRLNNEASYLCSDFGWAEHTVPICERLMCPYPEKMNDTRWVLTDHSLLHGSRVQYECLNGFNDSLEEMVATCDSGSWSRIDVECRYGEIRGHSFNGEGSRSSSGMIYLIVFLFVFIIILLNVLFVYRHKIRSRLCPMRGRVQIRREMSHLYSEALRESLRDENPQFSRFDLYRVADTDNSVSVPSRGNIYIVAAGEEPTENREIEPIYECIH